MGSTERQKRISKRPARFDDQVFELTRQKEKEEENTCYESSFKKARSDSRKAGDMERSVSIQTLKKKMKKAAIDNSNEELKKLAKSNISKRQNSEYLSEITTPSLCRESVPENDENDRNSANTNFIRQNRAHPTPTDSDPTPSDIDQPSGSQADATVHESRRQDLQDAIMYIEDMEVLAEELKGVPANSDIAKSLSDKIDCVKNIFNNAKTMSTIISATAKKDAATMVDSVNLYRQENQTTDHSSHEMLQDSRNNTDNRNNTQKYGPQEQSAASVNPFVAQEIPQDSTNTQKSGPPEKSAASANQSVFQEVLNNISGSGDMGKKLVYNDDEFVAIKNHTGKVIFNILRSYRSRACKAHTYNSMVANLAIALVTPEVIFEKIKDAELELYAKRVEHLVKMFLYRLEPGSNVPVLKIVRDGENVKVALKNLDLDSDKAAEVLKGAACKTIDERRNFFFNQVEMRKSFKRIISDAFKYFKHEEKKPKTDGEVDG